MKKLLFFLLCIVMMAFSGCKHRTDADDNNITPTMEVIEVPTIPPTSTPVQETPTPTITPEPTKFVTNPNLLTFQVQPIVIPEHIKTPFMSKEEFPKLDGSTANIPLGEAIYSYLTKATNEEAKQDLVFYKTPDSYRRLMKGYVDILFVYEPSQIILKEIQEAGAELEFKPLGRDALVFIKNAKNPVTSLTKEQLYEIYTGKTTNWKEVGGEDSEILPFQRPAASGSQTLMEKLAVPADQIMKGPNVVYPQEMGDLIDILASYNNERNALGYSVYFYANYMYSQPGLQFVAVDGIMPDNQTIQTGNYPYVNDFYVVIRKKEPKDSKARILYDWMTTKEAQTIVSDAGYVPVVDVNNSVNKQASKGVTIHGSLDINLNQYVIQHNITADGIYKGDSLLDRNLNTIMTFSGKAIQTGINLCCSKDDILILKSYDKENLGDGYELYSLSKQQYLTKHPYGNIRILNNNFYECSLYDYDANINQTTIFNPSGTCIIDISGDNDHVPYLTVAGSHFVNITDHKFTSYDQTGKIAGTTQIGHDYFSCSSASDCDDTNGKYIKVYLYDYASETGFCELYDEVGNLFSFERFEKNVPNTKDFWVSDCIYAKDHHFYVSGNIEDEFYIVRDDGTVIYKTSTGGEHYTAILEKDSAHIYDFNYESIDVIDYDGKKIKQDEDNIRYVGSLIAVLKDTGFDIYDRDWKLCGKVENPKYNHNGFFPANWDEDLPFVNYEYFNDTNDIIEKAVFPGVREFSGRINAEQTKEGYYLINYDYGSKEDGMILDQDGTTLLEAKDTDCITGVIVGNKIYAYVTAGNYEGIIDEKGNYIYQRYSSNLFDD